MSNILITTAISYTNGGPHIGHLYESVLADFLKKSFQQFYPTKLLTGTDEHGKKIESTAQLSNKTPIELCDENSLKFKTLNDKLGVSYDHFIRTTDQNHKLNVQESIVKSFESNDIYLDNYIGYYNVREECFITEMEAIQTNYKDPMTNKPYDKITEESYFFKLEKYMDYVKQLNTKLIFPSGKFNFDERLNNLKDLSISRTSFDWGIEFPKLISENKHIVYVWFDALLNYVSGAKLLEDNGPFNKTIHLIGKDIIWFHSVIYPAILKSCNYLEYQADKILVHGFILDKDGIKMSKSLNNVIDVDYLINKYPIEAIRYYLIMDTIWGEDIRFNEDRLRDLYNNQLIKDFGNLFQRLFTLVKPIQNEINQYFETNINQINLNHNLFMEQLKEITTNYDITKYKGLIISLYQQANKELTDKKPWDKSMTLENKVIILGQIIIKLKEIMMLLYPIIPNKINNLRNYLGWNSNFNILNISVDKVKAFVQI
jgi:methionyl-tRNA synthetase